MAEHEIDAIGAEASAMMNNIIRMATLVALRTRERGQKEADLRLKVMERQAKLQQLELERELRLEKAQDPRNLALERMVERTGVTLEREQGIARELGRELGAERAAIRSAERTMERAGTMTLERERDYRPTVGRSGATFDSAERRAALAMELVELGVAPELLEVRMLAEMANAKPAHEAAREQLRERSDSFLRERTLERTRERERDLGRER
jgi:hypothetical protein